MDSKRSLLNLSLGKCYIGGGEEPLSTLRPREHHGNTKRNTKGIPREHYENTKGTPEGTEECQGEHPPPQTSMRNTDFLMLFLLNY
ncbi:hypothetical protein E2C01_047257 [Portunus trituberculatus]|uniref:Uncharacterized protein n=1 Tax=Portunus trituberculatus TaxID=210409 RepID=A0A5B7G8B5_PORTR|nr:hypothetical protein [Portunus trituberculatus]